MPIYEYECPECGKFEVIQKVSEGELTECPRCKEKGKTASVKKVPSVSSFHLKGGGWYKTDYASGSSGKSGSSSSASGESSKSESSDKGSSSSEAKSCGPSCGCH